MNNEPLSKRKCLPCEGGTKALEQKFIDEYLEDIPQWWQEGQMIVREFTLPDFASGLALVNQIGALAEAEGHHPDIYLAWGKVKVTLSTHSIGGLSENDFILAAKIDQL